MNDNKHFYALDDPSQGLDRELSPGLRARIFTGERVMLSVVEVEPHAQGRIHRHQEEQWGVLLAGDGVRIQNGEEVAVKTGDFWLTPSGVSHGFIAGPRGARILDIFSPPREAYKTASPDADST